MQVMMLDVVLLERFIAAIVQAIDGKPNQHGEDQTGDQPAARTADQSDEDEQKDEAVGAVPHSFVHNRAAPLTSDMMSSPIITDDCIRFMLISLFRAKL